MARPEDLRRQASHLLTVAKRTKDAAFAETLTAQAGTLLEQAQTLEADPHLVNRDGRKLAE